MLRLTNVHVSSVRGILPLFDQAHETQQKGHVMTRRLRTPVAYAAALGVVAALAVAVPAVATATAPSGQLSAGSRHTSLFPTEIALPDGFQPEGIAIGALPFAFFGSRVDGDLYRANLVTGRGSVFSQGPGAGSPSLGLKVDGRGRLFVAGGTGGNARVVNAVTGAVLASYTFTTGTTFVNDVVLTPTAAWFTDSRNPVLYQVPLGRHGRLPGQDAVRTLPLSGAYQHVDGFNANGIARTPDGRALLIVQSATGLLFRVDPATGVTTQVDLGAETLANGDGLLLSGRTLYAVQNQLNRVAVVRLNRSGTAGTVVAHLSDPRFDIPTTVARFGDRLYLPNARFSTPPTPETTYTAVAIDRS
jgi:sugar lactone lactonase YvrE